MPLPLEPVLKTIYIAEKENPLVSFRSLVEVLERIVEPVRQDVLVSVRLTARRRAIGPVHVPTICSTFCVPSIED